MQSVQQRSPANFNNPFQSSNNAPHYRMEDSTSSRRGDQSATLPEFNGQNNIESQAEEVVIDFRPNTTENALNLQSNNTEMNPDFTSGINPEGLEANVLINGNNAPNQNAIEKMIKDLLIGILRWNLFSMFTFGISILVLTVGLPYLYLLVFLWLWNTYNIVTLSHNSAITHANRRKNALGIVSNLLSAIFKVFVIIHIETNALMLTIPLVPVLVSEVVFSLVSCVTNRKSPTSLFYKFELVFKFLLVAQAAMIALKIDNIIDWHWREVFSAYWVMFAATAGLGFGFFLMFTGKCCAYVFADIEMNQVRGIFWFFFVVGGKTALSCALVLEGINILQNGSELDNILGILIAIPVYSACVLIYTGIYFKEIEAIWRRLAAVDPQPFEDEEAEQKDKAVNKIEPEKVDIPKFLTKFSSTYFRRSTDDEVESAKTKQNKKSNNKDQGKTHKTTKRRQNSVDYQRVRNATNVTGHSTTNINLLTVPETEVERTKTTDWNNTSRFGLVRPDKGKDFFASLTDRTGVSGIIPSGIMTSKTDRFQTGVTEPAENKDYSPLTSNDSYLLPPVSKDTEAPLRPYRHNKDKRDQLFLKDARTPDLTTANTPDVSPLAFSPLGIIDDGAEIEVSQITLSKMHRRVQSMQDVSPTQIISLSEALESPKVKESARDHPEPLKSPASDQSQGVQCLICFDNVPDAVFMECGHGGVCYECSLEIWKSTNECYLCRNTITQVLQVDLKAKLPNHVIKVLSSTQMVLYEEEEEVA